GAADEQMQVALVDRERADRVAGFAEGIEEKSGIITRQLCLEGLRAGPERLGQGDARGDEDAVIVGGCGSEAAGHGVVGDAARALVAGPAECKGEIDGGAAEPKRWRAPFPASICMHRRMAAPASSSAAPGAAEARLART